MINIYMVGLFLITVMGTFLFHGDIKSGLLACTCLMMLFLFRMFLVKYFNSKKVLVIQGSLWVVTIFLLFGNSVNYPKQGIYAYADSLRKVENCVNEEDYAQALEVLDNIESVYGTDDKQVIYKTIIFIQKRQYENAMEELKRYKNTKDRTYYSLLEKIYSKGEDEVSEELFDMYVEAAKEHPDWESMQTGAGIAHMEQGNYQAAQYFFERAYKLTPIEGMNQYYLGTVHYELGNYEIALTWFEMALKTGVDEKIKSAIKYYVTEMSLE